MWRETYKGKCKVRIQAISIHSLRVEGDYLHIGAVAGAQFQSTPSVWRETIIDILIDTLCPFQSTPSVWRETQSDKHMAMDDYISIHSLRVEGDDTRSHL